MHNMEEIISKIVNYGLNLMHLKISDLGKKNIIQFIKFGIVGLTNTLVYYLTNLFTLFIISPLSLEKDYVIGNIVGFIVSVLWSFYWNNRFVFKQQDNEKRNMLVALIKVFASYAFTGIILSNVISFLLIDIAGWSKYIVPLINSIVGVPINFILNKLWAFKDSKHES